jgi:hypothetical protein
VIDSAVVRAPGAVAADTAPLMRNIYITALLATRDSTSREHAGLTQVRALAKAYTTAC